MGSAFTQADAILFSKNWYTHAVYTYGPVTLAKGTTVIFSAESWTPANGPEWQAELMAVWVTQNAGVQLSWTADNQAYNQGATLGFTDAAPGGLRRLPVYARAVRQLSMTATAAAAVDDFQLNYEIVYRKLTVADQLLYGYAPSSHLLALAQSGGVTEQSIRDLVAKGTAPVTWRAQADRTLLRLGDHAASGLYHVTASTTTAGTLFLTATRTGDEFLILEDIAMPAASAITLYGTRDEDDSLVQVSGAAFGQADYQPWPMRYIAKSRVSFSASAASTLTSVPVYIRIGRYRLTDLWQARLALGTPQQPAALASLPAKTVAQVAGGVQ